MTGIERDELAQLIIAAFDYENMVRLGVRTFDLDEERDSYIFKERARVGIAQKFVSMANNTNRMQELFAQLSYINPHNKALKQFIEEHTIKQEKH